MGTLCYGDHLDILPHYFKDESLHLVYLDPPFNSGRNDHAFFEEEPRSPDRIHNVASISAPKARKLFPSK